MPLVRDLLRPVGATHAQLLWRGYGVAAVLLALLMRDDRPLATFFKVYPVQLHAMVACALALIVAGPRPVTLLATAIAWVALIVLINGGSDPYLDFIADEYLLFLALPVAGTLSALLAVRAGDDEEAADAGQIAVFRIGLTATLLFAAFHKFNSDFLDPAVSCATSLARRLSAWSLPLPTPPPPAILALELATPLLLLWRPRLGVACALLLAAGLGHVGPVAFNTLVAVGSLAFLQPAALAAAAARWKRIAAIAGALLVVAGPLSFALYQDRRAWGPYFAFECALIVVAVLVAHAPRVARAPLLLGRSQRELCGLLIAVLVLSGVGPYLGLKYRYSFAMLSNLRVDDSRWNHLLVPPAVRVRDDRLVHVLEVRDGPKLLTDHPNPARAPTLVPGVYAPQEFRRRVEESARRKQRLGVALRYRGRTLVFEDLLGDGAAQQFVASLPVERMLQTALTLSRPQLCVH